MVKARLALALGLLSCAIGCRPRQGPPSERQPARLPDTLLLPVWDLDVAEDVATDPGAYRGKALIIRKAYLDPKRDVQIARGRATFSLRGGGKVLMPADAVPAWLRRWTAAPLTIEARVHPPRRVLGDAVPAPTLTASFIDFTHPIELAAIRIGRDKEGTWLTAHVENYRGHPAAATLTLRFGTVDETRTLEAVKPGGATQVRLKLFGAHEPAWAELPPEQQFDPANKTYQPLLERDDSDPSPYNPLNWMTFVVDVLDMFPSLTLRAQEFWVQAVTRQRATGLILAAHEHKAETGGWPLRLDELGYRTEPALVTDPFSGKPFCYRATGEGFILYSAGVDRDDDGGRHSRSWGRSRPDNAYDEYWQPDGDYVFWPVQW